MSLLSRRMASNAWATHTVQALFRETCDALDDADAIHYGDVSLSFRELNDRVDALSASLIRRGIAPGDVVSMLPSPTPDFAVVYFAVLQTGAVINPLNNLWSPGELTAVLDRNRPSAIVSLDKAGTVDMLDRVEACLRNTSPLLVAAGGTAEREGWTDLSTMCAEPITAHERADIDMRVKQADADRIQFICQTSGSTNISKSALWAHRSPLATAHFGAEALGITSEDSYVNLAPFYHNSGICASLTMCLAYAGIPLHLFDSFDPDEALEAIDRRKITTTFGFAAHWDALRSSPKYSAETFSIRRALLAGDSDLYRSVQHMCAPGTVLCNLYAQTENGPMVTITEHGAVDEELRERSNGRPLPGVELIIRDLDDGTLVPDGVNGEICYRSAFMFNGYLQDDGSVYLPLDPESYFRSGDVGRLEGGVPDIHRAIGQCSEIRRGERFSVESDA